MGFIQDAAGKLVQSFLSLDDLILGQSLISEGRSQLGLSSRTAAASAAASANLAVRAFQTGVQAGAKSAKATASALEGFVPGAGLARSLAERVDAQATEAGENASRLATHAVELTGGEGSVPRNPLTGKVWLGKRIPPGYSWPELAGDTAFDSFGRLAAWPLWLGVEAAAEVSSTRWGRLATESAFKGMGAMAFLAPGASSGFDAGQARQWLAALSASAWASELRPTLGLAEASARLALGDTSRLHQALSEAIEQMRLLAASKELGRLAATLPLASMLRERARSIVEHQPRKLFKALQRDAKGQAPTIGEVLSAFIQDAGNLRVFLTDYPLVVALLGADDGLALSAGLADVPGLQPYLQGKGDGGGSRSWSAASIESFIFRGSAPASTVQVAQDVAFSLSSQELGRENALERVERDCGQKARQRMNDDLSLDASIVSIENRTERIKEIRLRVQAASEGDLRRQRGHCQQQLGGLDSFARSLFGFSPQGLAQRRDILATFLSLANQDLAMRDASSDRGQQQQAQDGFLEWAGNEGPEGGSGRKGKSG